MTNSKCCKLSNGNELWLKDGKLHREDGPAVIRHDNSYASFYLDGMEYRFERWIKMVQLSPKTETILRIKYIKG